jgi:hypothetical protein
MRIFVSYSSKDRPLVQRIVAALNAAGFEIFVDTHDLPPGQEYNARLKMAVEDADLFIFLASDNSVEPGSYALTELSFAERKWRNPSGHVLPVLLKGFDPGQLPAYLRPINGLRIRGNPEAEVIAWVQERAEHGSGGVPGLLTPTDRLRRWARLAQPPLRRGRRIFPLRSVGGAISGVAFILFSGFALTLIIEGPFARRSDGIHVVFLGVFLFFGLAGIGLVLHSFWTAIQGLRGGGAPVPVVILGRTVTKDNIQIEIETVQGRRLNLSPVTRRAKEAHIGDLGWAYIRGGMLLEFVSAASGDVASRQG